MIGLLLRLLFNSMQDQYEPEAGPRRPRRRDDVKHAPVFAVLRDADRLEREGTPDKAVALLEDFMDETSNALFKDMCRNRIDRIQAKHSAAQQAADFLRVAGEAEPERLAEVDLLRSCRELFRPAPRAFRPDDRLALDPDLEQALVASNDGLLRILEDQGKLLARGRVVWGELVQANQILFTPENRSTCPANVIYSTDPFFDGRTSLLASMARGLFAQKGSTQADREMQGFVDAVTNEMARVLRREMPHSYTGGRPVNFATCFIQPAHLPHGFLNRSSFPVLVNPEETPATMLLPAHYWPPELVSHWGE